MDAHGHPLHVSVRSPRTASQGKRVTGHSLRTLRGATVDGLPISAPAHVWCQLSGMIAPEDLVAAGDYLVGARSRPARVTMEELSALSADVHRTKGGKARAWALPRIRSGADSRPETLLRLLLDELGAGEFAVNQPLVLDGGTVTLHPDLALPSERIAFEYEGDGHRVDRRQWFLDIRRHELLEAAGWRVVRVTADDLFRDRDALIARVRRFVPNLGNAARKTTIWHKS
ncbi:hypothetical protein [Leifsonia shinshuensis]|uniref:hypothetical protein n=1 Tax=Leifsonia shinshuensis TaxID=150026 RepID=UPI002855F564|nr:hypothetical protein [Leifsonia shinshuensis]MDR6970919.1 very-short-patch-repair endonuclease [Leifsonia shinshuensis]